MDSTLKALIVKKFKDSELDLDIGRHWIDETVVLRVSGPVERHEDQWILPTVSIPLIPVDAPTRSCGAENSRNADARSGVPARGWHEAGGGAVRETRRGQRPWAERPADGSYVRTYTTRRMPPPASRSLVARQFRSLALPVLRPEKPESAWFCSGCGRVGLPILGGWWAPAAAVA
jgi:hypothetical protein